MNIKAEGFSDLIADLKQRGLNVAGPGAVKAVRAGGRVIEAAMVERAPVQAYKSPGSNSLEPGELRASISTRVSRKTGQAVAVVGPRGKAALVGGWIEVGRRQVRGGESKLSKKGKVSGPGRDIEKDIPARPWARPAFEEVADAATETVAETILEAWESGKA